MSTKVPADLLYTKEHEWTKIQDGVATIGITDFAQNSLGDIVFVELPAVGTHLKKDATFGVVESIKSVSDLYVPLSGEVLEKNSSAEASPEAINESPYNTWLIKIKISQPAEQKSLMDAASYQKFSSQAS